MNIYVEDKYIRLMKRNGIDPVAFTRQAFLSAIADAELSDTTFEIREEPIDPKVCPECGRDTDWYGDCWEEATICSHCKIQWPADRI